MVADFFAAMEEAERWREAAYVDGLRFPLNLDEIHSRAPAGGEIDLARPCRSGIALGAEVTAFEKVLNQGLEPLPTLRRQEHREIYELRA